MFLASGTRSTIAVPVGILMMAAPARARARGVVLVLRAASPRPAPPAPIISGPHPVARTYMDAVQLARNVSLDMTCFFESLSF